MPTHTSSTAQTPPGHQSFPQLHRQAGPDHRLSCGKAEPQGRKGKPSAVGSRRSSSGVVEGVDGDLGTVGSGSVSPAHSGHARLAADTETIHAPDLTSSPDTIARSLTPAALTSTSAQHTRPQSQPEHPHRLLRQADLPNPATRPFTVELVMSRIHATQQTTRPLPFGNGLVRICSPDGIRTRAPASGVVRVRPGHMRHVHRSSRKSPDREDQTRPHNSSRPVTGAHFSCISPYRSVATSKRPQWTINNTEHPEDRNARRPGDLSSVGGRSTAVGLTGFEPATP